MEISIRAFASYREAIGSPRLVLEVPDGTTPAGVWQDLAGRFPRLQTLPQPFAFAINDEYVEAGTPLRERDELVLIPPVSGGSYSALTSEPIEVNALLERVRHRDAGAVVLFLGTVRDHNYGRSVQYLEYEAYQALALQEMARVASEAQRRWPLLGIAMEHRTGHLQVGDISVAIAVAAGHRREAFEAGKYAIDELKHTVPIWKKEVWEGGEEWVGLRPHEP
ncbi:MAG TPA: molybdenum cofactor biosynthesis protein MoaE [bacterium]